MNRRAKELLALTIGLFVVLVVLDAIWHPLLFVGGILAIAVGGFGLLGQLGEKRDSRTGFGELMALVLVGLVVLLSLGGGGDNTTKRVSDSVARKGTPRAAKRTNGQPRARRSAPTRRHHPAVAALALGAATKTIGCHAHGLLPDPACTPGVVFATATIGQICTPGYSEQTRDVSDATRAQVYAAYGIATHGGYEVDHLIPLEAGGSNEVANLWPERGYAAKDQLENQVHDDICSGTTPLRQAQRQLAHNWVVLARRNGITPTTPAPAPAAPTPPSSSPAPSTGIDKNCSDFSTHQEAQDYFDQNGGSSTNDVDGLDGNGDGIACSSLP